ncbi:MAG: amidohydrolase family protein [Cytophagaceae bacterium]|nr:amidohydrolase family protein [Gemmatimonadaceae bacterium]
MRLHLLAAIALTGALGTPALAQVTAFVDVSVLPMDRERVLERQTVIVRDGKVASIGPASSTSVPAGATRIDGRGKFLMPGLAEMHSHVPPQSAAEQVLKDIMFLYIANGVTTIRGMLGAPYQIDLAKRLNSGQMLGPTFFVAAPSLNGNTAPDPATAARLVREHKAAGYDLLKIHPGPSRASYDSAVVVARQVGITLGGHVPAAVGIDRAIEARQATIDHLDGYLEGSVSDEMKRRIASPTDTVRPQEIWRAVQPAKFRDYARRTKAAGVYNVPTMYLWENFGTTETAEQIVAAREEMKYATRQQVNGWMNQKRQRANFDQQMGVTAADADLQVQLRRQMLKALADEGAPLLMGTDSPQMFNVPGFALHRELQVAAKSGLTPWQILQSGTATVAKYASEVLKLDGAFGTVAPGMRADLVMLDANPLQDVANLAKRAGVMVRGKWVSGEEIRRGLEELEGRMKATQ